MKNNKNNNTISRRKFFGTSAAIAGTGLFIPNILVANSYQSSTNKPVNQNNFDHRYKIGVCDWMILKRQKLGAFKKTHEIGADGVELDMGGLGDRPTFDNKILDPVSRKLFRDEIKKYNIEICSIAMSGFYAQSFPERDTYKLMLRDCINSMDMMNVKVAFLPLGVKGDLVKHPELRPAVVERLKVVAEMAEASEVIIGIETTLDAEGELKLLEEIGSKAIQIYFNFQNPLEAGRELCEELKILGKDRICQIHCTDTDGVWLENNTRIDMPKVKETLDKMDWSGWLVIERSRDANDSKNVVGNFGANTKFMKSIFQ
ncbi:sugar phosphate isomerase/epimerase family protein [Bacteroidota bacterium]